jgi:hypothetical protein
MISSHDFSPLQRLILAFGLVDGFDTVEKTGVRHVTFKRISLRTTREPRAKAHNNEKGVPLAPKLCKSYAQRPLMEHNFS